MFISFELRDVSVFSGLMLAHGARPACDTHAAAAGKAPAHRGLKRAVGGGCHRPVPFRRPPIVPILARPRRPSSKHFFSLRCACSPSTSLETVTGPHRMLAPAAGICCGGCFLQRPSSPGCRPCPPCPVAPDCCVRRRVQRGAHHCPRTTQSTTHTLPCAKLRVQDAKGAPWARSPLASGARRIPKRGGGTYIAGFALLSCCFAFYCCCCLCYCCCLCCCRCC